MELLRINTAGSVDDGKSTLIGRLLYETKSISDDKLEAVEMASKRRGLDFTDLSLLTDGLVAEREQGITIDVAHIYFSTNTRRYIIADTPGHVEYTRNMVTGASNAQVSIILVDVRNQVVEQTLRHLYISKLLGIPKIIVAVNKMDLVDYSQKAYQEVNDQLAGHLHQFGLREHQVRILPVSSLRGENISTNTSSMPWYEGPCLLELLETSETVDPDKTEPVFQVQHVIRPKSDEFPDFRGYAGKVYSGELCAGDEITIYPSLRKGKIREIRQFDTNIDSLRQQETGVVLLDENLDVSRGEYILGQFDDSKVTNQFGARICWLDDQDLNSNQRFLMQSGSKEVLCKIIEVGSKIDLERLEETSAEDVSLNDICAVTIKCAANMYVQPYEMHPHLGSFILIDPTTKSTVAVGFIQE